ncbi:fumarylpyruvate hydrolase [Gemmobacter megaterium]|uniref:Fumarylpyruvate hydrolase n=1 Tax=Gemmobacter megaterium TaxID=1086013 RepID=A0A1N7Q2Z2_9RHOB|nr:fumarylacetoacetate hydrolase family protein [Gemmobacter megaterium]GGE22544.1 fumarylacetoacetate (FAA) hydrolase [Gemmobacter megaterium]SIT17218.1 fumarylpyruvate hydrolase [Gemmobacter megaterium]
MEYVFPPAPVPSLPVQGSDARFPVRRIFCVGRNYAEHAKEMGADTREPPFFFTKPADALVADGAVLDWPLATSDLHHEAELVVAIGKSGRDLTPDAAAALVWGYAPGIDLTRRDMQSEAKAMRRPWDMSKGFDESAPCGTLVPVAVSGAMVSGRITCTVSGEIRQDGDVADMIWDVPHIVSHLSGLVELAQGDLIFTGTPAGVGPVLPGESCRVEIAGLGAVEVRIG